MSSVQKQEDSDAPKLDTEQLDAGGGHTDSQIGDERRHHPDSKARDRRVILRLGHPEMRAYFKYISNICRVWIALSTAYIAAMIVGNISIGKIAVGRSLFYAVVAILVTISIYRFERSIRSYLSSESQAKLVTVAERLVLLLFIMLMVGAILVGAYLITLI